MFKRMLGQVNNKRLIMTVLALFVYIWASDFLIHQVFLKDVYQNTAALWRPESEMCNYLLWIFLAQFLIAKFFALLFVRGYQGKGVREGVCFGLMAGPFAVAPCFIQYAVSPLPQNLLWAWVFLGLLQMMGAGAVAGLVYRK